METHKSELVQTYQHEEISTEQKGSACNSCDGREVVIGKENSSEACLNDDNVTRNGCYQADDMAKNIKEVNMDERNKNCGINNRASASLESGVQGFSDSGPVEGARKPDSQNINRPPLSRSAGKNVDEALLEVDETGCSEDEEEHYESAEEEHLTREEAEVIFG